MNKLLNFDTLITPKVITVIYWLCLVAVVLASIASMFSGKGITGFIGGIVFLLLGTLAVRVYCEMIMIFFQNNQYLREISRKDKM